MKNRTAMTWKTALLAVGPVVSVLGAPVLLKNFTLPGEAPLVTLVVVALWSPLFFSIPALVLADARDRALPQYNGVFGSLIRGVLLIPSMMRSQSPVKTEMRASIAGFAAAVLVAAPVLSTLPALI
jgi:hypothetical protein